MAKFRLNRRTVLRGAGSIAIALPWLEAMEPEREARAQAAGAAKRFLAVYTPGGTVYKQWAPTGMPDAPVLSPILSPLESMKKKLLILDGLEMQSAVGEQHQAGIIAWLTGSEQKDPPPNGGIPGANSYTNSPSIDQMIATRISAAGKKPIPSIQMAVRWGTGKAQGHLSPISCANFEDKATATPIPPSLDPQKIWKETFGSLGQSAEGTALTKRNKSILDFIDRKYAALSPRLGMFDREKIEGHLDKIRELEKGLGAISNGTATCAQPIKVDTTGYKPDTTDMGAVKDSTTDQMIPVVGKFMMDMMIMAFSCDLTAVGTLQWTDTEAKHTFPWLAINDAKPNEHHHFYQHDGGFKPLACEQICNWYSQMHAYLLQGMDKVVVGDHTLLDESVVFFGSELGDPPSHSKVNMPFLLAGKGGGLRPGRWLKYNRRSHNDLLVAIMNLFGDPRTTVGPAKYNGGALALT